MTQSFTPPPRNSIRKNLAFKVAGTVVEKALKLAMVPLIARTLGPRVFGQYGYALTVATLAVQMTDLGLGLFLTREIAREATPPPKLIGQVLTLKAMLAVGYVLVMAALVLWYLSNPDAGKAIVPQHHASALAFTLALVGLSTLATSAVEMVWQVFRGVQRLELEARSSSVFAGLQLIGVFTAVAVADALWPGGADLSLTMVAIAVGMAAAGLGGAAHAVWLMRKVVTPEYGWSRDAAARFTREALPLGVTIIASLVYFKIDILLLRSLRGDEETGWYSAAYKQLEYSAIIPAIVLAATFPAISRTVVENPQKAWLLHRRALLALGGVGVAAACVLGFFPQLIVRTLYGTGYEPSIEMLRVLAPSVILTMVNYLETHMLVALGLVSAQAAFTLVLVCVNVGANWFLIPAYGGVGAAVATALTEVVLLSFCAPLVWRELRTRVLAETPA